MSLKVTAENYHTQLMISDDDDERRQPWVSDQRNSL